MQGEMLIYQNTTKRREIPAKIKRRNQYGEVDIEASS
jgi:hypothetical protein